MSDKDYIGVVLAGGMSTRMGKDKAELKLGDANFLSITLEKYRAIGLHKTVILGKEDHPDQSAGGGPALALLDYIQSLTTPSRLIVMPVDLPLVPAHFLEKYMKKSGNYAVEDSFFPLFLTVHEQGAAPATPGSATGGPASIREVMACYHCEPVPIAKDDLPFFMHCNTPADYDKIVKINNHLIDY